MIDDENAEHYAALEAKEAAEAAAFAKWDKVFFETLDVAGTRLRKGEVTSVMLVDMAVSFRRIEQRLLDLAAVLEAQWTAKTVASNLGGGPFALGAVAGDLMRKLGETFPDLKTFLDTIRSGAAPTEDAMEDRLAGLDVKCGRCKCLAMTHLEGKGLCIGCDACEEFVPPTFGPGDVIVD